MDMYDDECVKLHNESMNKSLLNEKSSETPEDIRVLKAPKIFYGIANSISGYYSSSDTFDHDLE